MEFVYRGLKAENTRHIVTAQEVTQNLQRLQQQNPRIEAVTGRPTRNGDEVVLDYAGFCDGEQFAGGTAEYQTLTLGSGMFIPGFEEQLLDKMPGEDVTVKVTFPKSYHAPNLAGKEAEFRCHIHEIRVKSVYELDDVFAKEVGGCESFAEMEKKMAESLQAYTDQRGEMDLQDYLLRMATDTLDYMPTEEQIQEAMDDEMDALHAQLAQQGLTMEMYCSFMQTTEENIREASRNDALVNLKMQATVQKIAQLENLEVTKEEIAEATALVARQNNMTLEQLKPYYNAEFEAAVVRSVLTSKVMKLVRDAAEITETEA